MTADIQPEESPAADDGSRREIEWQLSAQDLGLVRKWLSEHGSVDDLTIEPRPTHVIHDTYLDTEDFRIRRAGYALRLRDLPGARRGDAEGSRPRVRQRADPARVQ